jgi:FkbH-like protein
MYETEINLETEAISEIPSQVVSSFKELDGKILSRTLIPWGEHCTECGWPTCYSTCELYAPREDLKCRRFVDGMVRVECPGSVNGYLVKVSFKRWGKLWARGNFKLVSPEDADQIERRDYKIGTALQKFPLSKGLRRSAAIKRYSFKKRLASRGVKNAQTPTSFLFECYNPHSETVRLSLTMRTLRPAHPVQYPDLVQLLPGFKHARELKEEKIPFQSLFEVAPGFSRVRIPFEDIAGVIDLSAPYGIDIIPNESFDGVTLYFGALDFVTEPQTKQEKTAKKPNKIKCVIWDLDNTVWNGILLEDGIDKIRLRPGIPEVIQELDRRGILNSVASKNNHDDAILAIRKFGLAEYFLRPQISWQPKSETIKKIAKVLNIGMDTFLFVDDSQFEMQEVQAACPKVRILDAARFQEILGLPECNVPVTEESASRRKLYQLETIREAAAENFGEDYMSFLRDCKIKLKITALTEENLVRVHELATRTNQMNFSGNRYDLDILKKIVATPHLATYVLSCEDRFGSYGVIGFSIVDRREARMTDLMFSCRVQSKRVEHAFLSFVIGEYFKDSENDFLVSYRKTEKNAPSGQVFWDMGMREIGNADGVLLLSFPRNQAPPDDGIISIETDSSTKGAHLNWK